MLAVAVRVQFAVILCTVAAVHEKIFILFMVTSLMYELVTLVVFRWAHPDLIAKPHVSIVLGCGLFQCSADRILLFVTEVDGLMVLK